MAIHLLRHTTLITAVLLLTVYVSSCAKQTARPVHEVIEVINEQARIDEKPRNIPGILPYGNPLAGNVKQNIRLHAHNQQAMFNAERIRQHKAQLQRWTKAPQTEDSYMKAYHESQESHQLALEQQQATLMDAPVTKAPRRRGSPKPRQETLKSGINPLQDEPTKITKADAVIKTQRSRSHRSYGSVEFQQHLQPQKYKTVYISPGPTYDQGVTIKPNGNIGFTHLQNDKQPNTLYTQAVPSNTKYIYPKQYSQMQSYQSIQDIDTLNSLLKKDPHEQLNEFNALLSATKENAEENDTNNLDTPIDLYFYLKDPSTQTLTQHYDSSKYAQIPNTYASAYLNDINALRDHTPITEEVDDIEDTNQVTRPKTYVAQPAAVTPVPDLGTTTKKSNNYYKVEVASQTITTGHTQNGIKEEYNVEDHQQIRPAYEALYGQQPTAYYVQDTKQIGDLNERYLHHNAQHKGIQHLSEDGVGVSAYGDDNVSIRTYEFKVITNISIAVPARNRNKRDVLDTQPFLLPNDTQPLTEMPNLSSETDTDKDPKSESLIRPGNKNRMSDLNFFVSTPNFPIGESIDYTYNDYDDIPLKVKRPTNHKFELTYEDDDYNNYNDDFSSPEYEVGNFKTSLFPAPTNNPVQSYSPSATFAQSPDLKSSFSNKFGQFKRYPNFGSELSQIYSIPQSLPVPPATTYGVPEIYGVPSVYGTTQNFRSPVKYVNHLTNIDNILEPVYMLTQSQLQGLITNHNLNIEHLDVYQLSKDKRPLHYPRKYRKRYPYRGRHVKKNLHKLHKLNVV